MSALLTVDLGAVAHNVRRFSRLAPLLAVVKADGFGHGAVQVARTALSYGARGLGVTSVDEALALRAAGLRAPVLSWLNPPDADFGAGLAAGVVFAVSDLAGLESVARAAGARGLVGRVHLHLDTGMARDGAPEAEWERLAARAAEYEWAGLLRVTGVMGHLPCAAEPDDPTNRAAVAALRRAGAAAHRLGLHPAVRHLAASAGAFVVPGARLDVMRVGAGLYGIDAVGGHGLRRALTLTAPVVMVRDVAAGTGVGYGHTYRAPTATRLALLPLGYADGVPYAAAGRAAVWLAGRRCPVVGAVSMDQTVVDVGAAEVRPGDVATVFGPGGGGEGAPTTGDWAAWCGVPEHAVMTGIGPRVRRVWREAPAPAGGRSASAPTGGRRAPAPAGGRSASAREEVRAHV